MRMKEREARTLLLIRAVEDADKDGVLLPLGLRAAATRRVFDEAPERADDETRLRKRATLLRNDLLTEAPALRHVLEPARRWHVLVAVTIVGATVMGTLTNLFGPKRHVSVLAFPLAGIVGWNCVVYVALVIRVIARTVARARRTTPSGGRLAFLGRWLEGMRLSILARRLGGSTRSVVVTEVVQAFQGLWLAIATSLIAARVRVVLHVAAFAMALGAIAGMYASGIAFEYRATWESTWFDAATVQRYVDVVLGPAARVLGVPVPDVAPLRGPGRDGHAGTWIHLWATTLGLFVLIPRAVLALGDALTAARLSRRLPVEVDAGYTRRALHSGRGHATVVDVVYYGCAPEAPLRERLHAMLQDQAGARAVIHDSAWLAYGDGAERVTLPEYRSVSGILAIVFALAQTPEYEVHGEFLERTRERVDRARGQMAIVLETATYRQRVGSIERVRERRATWDRLLRDLDLTALELA
jgi:hypothetical protein